MAGSLVAGVDCSTQSTKVLIVDPHSGQVVAGGRAEHEVTGSDGARETHPSVWWDALRQALSATGRADDVGAVAVAGQQHGLVVQGDGGAPLRPATLWNDTRSAADAAELAAQLGGPAWWAAHTGSVPVASFTVTSWAWLRRTEPHVAGRVRAIRLPHDHLTERLTGRGVTDRGDASGTGWWSPSAGDYVGEVLGLDSVDLDPSMLPEVLDPTDSAGEVAADAAEDLGVPAGVVVAPGTGDNMAAALGLGSRPGTPVLSLGTSGTVFVTSERAAADPSGVVAGFADATGRFLPLACTLNCTLAVDRVAGWLGLDRDACEPGQGVVVLPYLDGERTPNLPAAAGAILGLRHATTREQVLGAAYEGATASLLEALERLDEHSAGVDPDAPLVLIGGGAAGRAWQETVRRLSGRALVVPAATELVALGAAAQAAGLLTGTAPEKLARSWDTAAGKAVEAPDHADDTLARIRETRDRATSVLG